ncbi:MFS transporter [Niastella sp. OAS944]|uniref:MFS transporter n=1 Tax=Niastella sp. OAS944 TaxID=2664089 RepID=UPI0034794DFB|nr:MFS family permease [Chitinophagaceae bacterium OAS944]
MAETISIKRLLTPIVITVLAVYLTIGVSLGVLPKFIKQVLGFGDLTVGVILGIQALATLLTRAYSGKITDTLGSKTSTQRGVMLVLVAGIFYLLAGMATALPVLSLCLLALSRIIHGIAESMLATGALTWGIGLVGQHNSGKVMTWNGIAMYAGIAIGAPFSLWLVQFGTVLAFATIPLLSLVSWFSTRELPVVKVDGIHVRTPFYKVIGKVSIQGLALAFSSIAFACIASFISLLFTKKQWDGASLGFICFGGSYILTRVFFSAYPDRFGGFKVAIVSIIIEVAGQLCIGFSTTNWLAIAGCTLTGTGFSLVFPSLGVLAIKKVPPQMRGTALGAYAAFFDLALGIAGPVAGLIAGWFSYQAIYIFGAISCLLAVIILLFKQHK